MSTDVKTEDRPASCIAFTTFLESSPPGIALQICDLYARSSQGHMVVTKPDIRLHCPGEPCGGTRSFRCTDDSIYVPDNGWKNSYMVYRCRNCEKSTKRFAIAVLKDGEFPAGRAYKYGELPAFGPPTPARVITLIGPDRELYLQGRRAENLGLGIGAFAYYRRVVEQQKGRIIREIGRVAK
jgi:hypothetical protein